MKKNISLIILVVVSFFLNISFVQADGMYKYVCEYELNATDKNVSSNYHLKARISFSSSSNMYVSWEHKEWGGTGALSTKSADLNEKKVFMESRVKSALFEGECPKYVYVDFTGSFNLNSEICFDNDKKYCQSQNANGRDFSNSLGQGTLKNDIKSDLKEFFNNYAITTNNVLNPNFDLAKDVEEKITKQVVRKGVIGDLEIVGEKEFLSFLISLDEYAKGFDVIKEKYEQAAKKALANAEDEYNRGNATIEDVENIEGIVNDRLDNLDGAIHDAQAEINFGYKDLQFAFKPNFKVDSTCRSYLGDPKNKEYPAYYLQFAFDLMKYLAIILLFVLTIVEYAKAAASSNQDAMKKATNNTVKRLIIAVVIFFLPLLIEFVLGLFGIYGDCGIG